MVVFKYPLNYQRVNQGFLGKGSKWEKVQQLELPMGSQILKVELQEGQLMCWAKTDPSKPNIVKHTIEIVGTGHEIETPDVNYVGTFFDGGLVFHVFTKFEIHPDYEKIV